MWPTWREAAAECGGGPMAFLCRVGVPTTTISGKVLQAPVLRGEPPGPRNPHDLLKPATASAAIVREPCGRRGSAWLREAEGPPVLHQFIPRHHGHPAHRLFLGPGKGKEAGGEGPWTRRTSAYPGPPAPEVGNRHRDAGGSVGVCGPGPPGFPPRMRIRELIDRLVEARIPQGQLVQAPPHPGPTWRPIREQFARGGWGVLPIPTGWYYPLHPSPFTRSPREGSPPAPCSRSGGAGGSPSLRGRGDRPPPSRIPPGVSVEQWGRGAVATEPCRHPGPLLCPAILLGGPGEAASIPCESPPGCPGKPSRLPEAGRLAPDPLPRGGRGGGQALRHPSWTTGRSRR